MDAAATKSARAAMTAALLLVWAGTAQARSAPQHLRDTGLYAAGSTTRCAPTTCRSRPQYPLWSDGADKRRWVRSPPARHRRVAARRLGVPGRHAAVEGVRASAAAASRRASSSGCADGSWRFATYVWNADGSDAVLAPDGGARCRCRRPAGATRCPRRGRLPRLSRGRAGPVLGFSALQLSPDRDPLARRTPAGAARATSNLRGLVARGLLRNLPRALLARRRASPPRRPTERAALGYLHGNCGDCHNAERRRWRALGLTLAHAGRAGAGGDAVLASTVGQPEPLPPPAAAATLRIAPGRPDASVLAAAHALARSAACRCRRSAPARRSPKRPGAHRALDRPGPRHSDPSWQPRLANPRRRSRP